jgi:hypothetical protein
MKRAITVVVLVVSGLGCSWGQTNYPPETKNAALRYWMAFAEMQDKSTDAATQQLLEKTAAGDAPWDEATLSSIVDANEDAIHMMQRATRLPDCDWGLEYSRGPMASIAYAPRARALARLNTLEGIRKLSQGDSQSAVNAWLAGIRFSRDLARGGTLIFSLMAKNTLVPNLRLLTAAAKSGKISETEKTKVISVLKTMPEDGFDWSAAWGLEAAIGEQLLQEVRSAPDPNGEYEAIMGKPAPKLGFPPAAPDIQEYREYMLQVRHALHQNPTNGRVDIESLGSLRNKLGEVEFAIVPNPQKTNAARLEIMNARAELLATLTGN